jgi:hypothetical protein
MNWSKFTNDRREEKLGMTTQKLFILISRLYKSIIMKQQKIQVCRAQYKHAISSKKDSRSAFSVLAMRIGVSK